jgi:Holliday junction resolvasome RuvABC DNA-binding subunit
MREETAVLQRVPGIGKKTAERIMFRQARSGWGGGGATAGQRRGRRRDRHSDWPGL